MHPCTLEDGAYVGMGAQVMDEAVIESGAMLAAGALLTQKKRIPHGELWAVRPATLMRRLSEEEMIGFARTAENYAERGRKYRLQYVKLSVEKAKIAESASID